jgi:hypothetical protein
MLVYDTIVRLQSPQKLYYEAAENSLKLREVGEPGES